MTHYVAAALQNLIFGRLAFAARSAPAAGRAPLRLSVSEAAETLPMLFRSEGFAEDLLDSPSAT